MQVTTIGLDIAKNVFQVHGIDAAEKVVVRKQLRRSQVLEDVGDLPRIEWLSIGRTICGRFLSADRLPSRGCERGASELYGRDVRKGNPKQWTF